MVLLSRTHGKSARFPQKCPTTGRGLTQNLPQTATVVRTVRWRVSLEDEPHDWAHRTGHYLRQGNGMAPEVRWQASEPARSSGSDFRAPGEDSVEILLRRLIRRIEESERRYAEALDELHARLGHVSHTAGVAESLASPEESETLERLRLQLSGLARRLEQPPPPERAQPLAKALEEVRAVQAGLAGAEPNWFQSRYSPVERYFAD